MTQQAISIHNNYEGRPGNSNWSTEVEFDLEAGTVDIHEFFGNGQSMRSFHGINRFLGTSRSAEFANVDAIVELLEGEEAQGLMATVMEGFESVWDGSNHVGRLTEDAADALETLQNLVEGCWESLPTYWESGDWYQSISAKELLAQVEGRGDIETAAEAEVAQALPEYHLEQDDVKNYLRNQLEKMAADEDEIELANRARKLLDMKPLTTLQAQFDEYDQRPSGVKFTEHTLQDGTEVTLVDDGGSCWLADPADLEAAMEAVIEDGRKGEDAQEDGCWWYEVLCQKVLYQRDAVAAFEAEFGSRNWA